MNRGDRVELLIQVGFCQPGCQGIVQSMVGGLANVNLDRETDGRVINPPMVLPAKPASYFKVIG